MTFDKSIQFVFKWEGGYSNHPEDPGGVTNYGISIRFAGSINLDVDGDGRTTGEDIRALSRADAKDIYYRHFWKPAQCDELKVGVSLIMLDTAVNTGCNNAIRLLQSAVGTAVDGIWGPNTNQAVSNHDPETLIWELTARRNQYYGSLGKFPTFGLGWMRRSADCHQTALTLLRG